MNTQIEERIQRLFVGMPGIKLGLDRVHTALASINHPEKRLPPTLHVAGTNGKGSTLAFLTAICEAHGLTVHRYTSPHLVSFHERIYLAGQHIDDATLVHALDAIIPVAEAHELTFFEATTLMAMRLFAETPADILLLETGLGGRLDATNVVASPALTCITPIGMDHQDFLGNSLSLIAKEKAGIIKQGRPCVIGYQPPEAQTQLIETATSKDAPISLANQDWSCEVTEDSIIYHGTQQFTLPKPSLRGAHQPYNAATALACAEQLASQGLLQLSPQALSSALKEAIIPARLQPITLAEAGTSSLWVDGGHNPMAGEMLAKHIATEWKGQSVCLITAMKKDKEFDAFLKPLLPLCEHIIHADISSEGIEPIAYEDIARIVTAAGRTIESIPTGKNDIAEAVKQAAIRRPDHILVAGSLYLAGKLLSYMQTIRIAA